MKLISARLKGLCGIYNKSGIKEINIDFSKCMHNIIYIIGKNGSGKSTLMSVLQPLPDSPTMFLEGELGEKELVYINEEITYRILIQYPVYSNGKRAATKAFFSQIDNNGTVELNSNGTVGSFKDIVYSKFNLDPNFISLSHLSVEDRGIVEKNPSERKKFIGSLLESVAVYNDMYKTLVKRSGSFKSLINSIIAKMDSIGDEEKLIMDKAAADNRYQILMDQKSELEQNIAASRATINIIDPDNVIRNKYDSLMKKYNEIKNILSVLEQSIPEDMGDLEVSTKLYVKLSEDKHSVETSISILDADIKNLLSSLEEDNKAIFIKNQKYTSLMESSNIDSIKKSITEYRKKIFGYEEILKKIKIKYRSISKDEYITGLETLKYVRDTIIAIKSYASEKSIIDACDYILNYDSYFLPSTLERYGEDKQSKEEELSTIKEQIFYYNGLMDKVTILDNRPSKCNIDECVFIKDALDALKEKPKDRLNKLFERQKDLIIDIEALKDLIENMQLVYRVYNDIDRLYRGISNNKSIINKLPIGKGFTDKKTFIERISNGDNFTDIETLYSYISYSNIFDMYDNDKEILNRLETEYHKAEIERDLILELQKDIDDLVEKTSNLEEKIRDKQNEKLSKQKELEDLISSIDKLDNLISVIRKRDKALLDKKDIESQLNVVSDNIEKISKEVENINKYRGILQGVINELNPLISTRDTFNFSLSKLKEYKEELKEYQDKYNIIELLKKYSSPTKGGIQTIFMQLYMDKTLSLANQLLGMLFSGDIELLPYIINENEFRIPVKSNITNLVSNDVSYCSTSEKSMIAMIMSFALAFHSSQVYNIVRLDEVDGGLDQANRAIFPIILNSIINMLHIEQCFIISHSSESDMSDVDIISLTPVSNETIKGNVIFQL